MKFNRQPNFTHCYNVKFIAVINWSDYNKDFTTTKKSVQYYFVKYNKGKIVFYKLDSKEFDKNVLM